MNGHFFIYNNEFFRAGVPVIQSQNRSFRYGDGLFETMRMHSGKILNMDFHFDRLFAGMNLLQMKTPSFFSLKFFTDSVNQLLEKNSIFQNARIRLMVFGGEEPFYQMENIAVNFLIEVFPLEHINTNEEGLIVEVFPDGRKSCDTFSHLKSNNYLTSLMAARFAAKNNWDEAIILNAFGRVCESSVANIFIVKNNDVFTPPLSEGCVAGVMRRWILERLSPEDITIAEKKLSIEDLLSADELFLTNAIHPVRWVKQFRNKIYTRQNAMAILDRFVEQL